MRIADPVGAHAWHAITTDAHTFAMQVPGGALIRYRAMWNTATAGTSMVFVPGVVVAHRWLIDGDEAHRETGLQRPDQFGAMTGGWALVNADLDAPPEAEPRKPDWHYHTAGELWERLDDEQRFLIRAALDGEGLTLAAFADRFPRLKAGGVGKRLTGIGSIVARDMPGLPTPVWLDGPRGAKTIAVDPVFKAAETLSVRPGFAP